MILPKTREEFEYWLQQMRVIGRIFFFDIHISKNY